MTCWLCGSETTELATNVKAPACEIDPCQICIAVANVDEEINQAVATLRRLLTKRCDLRTEQNRIHGTLIHRLPTEIKDYIFELLAPRRTEWGKILPRREWGRMGGQIGAPQIPLYTSICRNWRDIACSNPFLWSTIHITLGSKVPPSDTSNPTAFVRDWILRSQTLPLALHIAEKGRSDSQELKGVIGAIGECSKRCHSLSLDIVSWESLQAFHHSNFQCHLLRSLRISARGSWPRETNGPVLSNLTISPEKIEIYDIPFQSLQISWNHLTSAKVVHLDLEDLTQLFRHASQMTSCHISEAFNHSHTFLIPPVVHHNLKTLGFHYARETEDFLASLTLPGLQEFHANEMYLLEYLPALVHRSSCPLTRITFRLLASPRKGEYELFDYLQPLPGMTDLVVENVEEQVQTVTIKRLLLREYFPDLRHLTLRLDAFHFLWDEGVVIPLLLDRNRLRLGAASKGRLRKILVIHHCRTGPGMFDIMKWNSHLGEQLKAFKLDINLREDGFEILIPDN